MCSKYVPLWPIIEVIMKRLIKFRIMLLIAVALNEACEIEADCGAIRFGTCSKYRKCVCKDAHVKIDRITCAPSVGAACSEEIKCVPANLICSHNKCQYFTNTSTLFNGTTGPSKDRFSYKEVVNINYSLNFHKFLSIHKVILGSSCQADSDCIDIPYSICSTDKKCICDSNAIALNLLTCVPTVNGFCTNNNQCYLESFYCINNTCQCKPNFTPVSAHQCIKSVYKLINHFILRPLIICY